MATTRGIMRPRAVGRAFDLHAPPVPRDLAGVVDRLWVVTYALAPGETYRSEVLAHPSVHLVAEPHGTSVYGVVTARDTRILSGEGYAAGARFAPGAFGRVWDGSMAALTDRAVPVAELFGDAGAALAEATARARDHDERLACVTDFVRARMRPADGQTALVTGVVEGMRHSAPGATVAEIASAHHVSSRTLQRLFRRHVGVSPKWVLRRYRLQTALAELEDSATPDWTRLALDLGYFDHAHFIRDFREVAGCSPSEYRSEAAK